MRALTLIALSVFLALTAGGQSRNKRISTEYDKFKDRSLIKLGPYNIGGDSSYIYSGGLFYIAVGVFHRGERITQQPLEVQFSFLSNSDRWRFIESRDLYAIVDGERMSLGRADRSSEIGRRSVTEELRILVPLSIFERIANAKSVEMKLGYKEFKLKEEHLQGFRDLLIVITP